MIFLIQDVILSISVSNNYEHFLSEALHDERSQTYYFLGCTKLPFVEYVTNSCNFDDDDGDDIMLAFFVLIAVTADICKTLVRCFGSFIRDKAMMFRFVVFTTVCPG